MTDAEYPRLVIVRPIYPDGEADVTSLQGPTIGLQVEVSLGPDISSPHQPSIFRVVLITVMADGAGSAKSSITANLQVPTEDTPLLNRRLSSSKSLRCRNKSVVNRILLTAFMVSLSFSVTQVPLIYVFGVMTCDEYYKTHPDTSAANRCRLLEIEAETARSVALLGAGTTLFGVFNLFFTGWAIKALGVKKALMLTVFFPAIRLAIQNVGVEVGSGPGIIIVQCSQIITVVGGPGGYLLALNSFAAEVVEPEQRTATLGKLSGSAMFGTSLGFLAGGYLGDIFVIAMPFRVTLVLFLLSFLYISLALPTIKGSQDSTRAPRSLSGFFDPLKMFVPQQWRLVDGRIRKEHGVLFLGIGTFLGVLSYGYVPVLLQMYSSDVFGFGTKENGWLISLNSLIRGLFLTLAFPAIITHGRKWLDRRNVSEDIHHSDPAGPKQSDFPTDLPTDPSQVAASVPNSTENAAEPVDPPKLTEDKESYAFDLWFTKYSLIADGLLTGLATFTTKGWQMYLIAVLLPLASGTGPSAKGTILQMCPASQRADALSAISLVELVARLTSTGVFGLVFSAFAQMGQPNLTFTVTAAIAVVGFVGLLFARFPPEGSVRCVELEPDQDNS